MRISTSLKRRHRSAGSANSSNEVMINGTVLTDRHRVMSSLDIIAAALPQPSGPAPAAEVAIEARRIADPEPVVAPSDVGGGRHGDAVRDGRHADNAGGHDGVGDDHDRGRCGHRTTL